MGAKSFLSVNKSQFDKSVPSKSCSGRGVGTQITAIFLHARKTVVLRAVVGGLHRVGGGGALWTPKLRTPVNLGERVLKFRIQ